MTTTTVENATVRYSARGFTDDVTTCELCGKEELKGTVRLVLVDADGNDQGEVYAGVTCAARHSGRKATDIRTEAVRADKARVEAIRARHRAWSDAHCTWFCAVRDDALGENARVPEIVAWETTEEFKDAEAWWLTLHPEPQRPW